MLNVLKRVIKLCSIEGQYDCLPEFMKQSNNITIFPANKERPNKDSD